MKQIRNLPSGWSRAKIGDVRSKTEQVDPKGRGKFVYIDIGSVDRGRKVIYNPQVVYGSNAPSRARKLVKSGDTLVSLTRPNLNSVCLVGEEYDGQIASTGFDVLRLDGFDARWIYYIVRTKGFVDKMSGLVQGALYPAIRSADVDSFEIPVAPVNEQRRIADKLDRVLARVDAANEHLSRVGPLLKRFRQEVLREAVSGRILGGNGYKGRRVALSEVCDMRLGKMLDQAKNKGNFVPYIGNINVRWFGFDLSSLKRIRIESHEVGDLEISDGDLMVCEGGEPGRCAVWNGGATDIVFQKALHRVRPHEGVLDSWWLAYNLKIQCDSGEISGLLTGSTIKHLTGRSLGRFSFYLPDYEEQRRVVAIVKSLFAFADILEGRTLTTKQNVQGLFPSVLSKAFRGDLIPQILGDEPASEFLARVADQ